MSETTDLSEEEVALADLIARGRQRRAIKRAAGPTYGSTRSMEIELVGARGEVGVAKLLGLYPNLLTYEEEKARGGFDFPHRIGVRAAQKRFGLLVHPEDPPDGRFVAVVVGAAQVTVLGWDTGEAVQDDAWWTEPQPNRPCYLKPERLLQPLSTLRAVIAAERAGAARVTAALRADDSWLCAACRRQVALRDGLCGACWLAAWKQERTA